MDTMPTSLDAGQKICITFVHGLKREYTFRGLVDGVIHATWVQNRRGGSYTVVSDKVPLANVKDITLCR